LPHPAVHARTPDDCRRDVTAPTLGNGVEACGVAPRCRGGHSAYRGGLASRAKTTGRSKHGFAAAASGHSLQHVLDNGRSLAAPNLIARRAFGASHASVHTNDKRQCRNERAEKRSDAMPLQCAWSCLSNSYSLLGLRQSRTSRTSRWRDTEIWGAAALEGSKTMRNASCGVFCTSLHAA
jgi:hypothetical protein